MTPRATDFIKWPRMYRSKRLTGLSQAAVKIHQQHEAGAKPPATNSPGKLSIRSLALGGIKIMNEFRRPRKGAIDSPTPILALNDEPLAVGFGTAEVDVEDGNHIVSAQIQDSEGECCVAVPLAAKSSNPSIDYVAPYVDHRREHFERPLIGRIGARGVLPRNWPGTVPPGLALRAFMIALIVIVLSVAAAWVGQTVQSRAAAFVSVIAPVVFLGSAITWFSAKSIGLRATARSAGEARTDELMQLAPVKWASPEPGYLVWNCATLSDRWRELAPPTPGRGLIVVEQSLTQKPDPFPAIALASQPPVQNRRFTAAPVISVGGTVMASGWGTWIIEVPEGTHSLNVSHGEATEEQVVSVSSQRLTKTTVALSVVNHFSNGRHDAEFTHADVAVRLSQG